MECNFKIERDPHVKGYTMISNASNGKVLTLAAKGLLKELLSLPSDWHLSIGGLAMVLKDGKDAISSALKELEDNGYITRQKQFSIDKCGRRVFAGCFYTIYENPYTENPHTENPCTEIPCTENGGDIIINNKEINKDNKDLDNNNKDYSSPSTRVREEKEFDERYFVEKFNEVLTSIQNVHPVMFRRLEGLSPERKEQVEYLSGKYGDEYFWNVIIKAFQSQFLNQRESGFKYDLDWIINENNFLKVAEDKYKELYDNKEINNGRADIGLAGKTANERAETLQERIRRENDDFLNGKGEDRGLPESIF